jgi:outer membrane protein OmpA-like peptidoglycan-associated protein
VSAARAATDRCHKGARQRADPEVPPQHLTEAHERIIIVAAGFVKLTAVRQGGRGRRGNADQIRVKERTMRGTSRSRGVFLLLSLALAVTSLPACKQKKQVQVKEEGKADLEQEKAQAKKSLADLQSQVSKLRAVLADAHKRADALPADMPDLNEFRSKLLTVEEVFGVEDGRVKWLSGKLDAAIAAGSKEQLTDVTKTIHDSIEGNDGSIIVKLTHQLMWFEDRVFTGHLPTGVEIKGAKFGVEERLIEFIEDAKKKIDRTAWFRFDRVSFPPGDTKLDPNESKNQLQNVVAILKAYPKVKLKIGAFTDNTAPEAANKKLSAARAASVKAELISLDAAAPRLSAEGYGSRDPVCPPNDTGECKMKNQRIAAQVTAK